MSRKVTIQGIPPHEFFAGSAIRSLVVRLLAIDDERRIIYLRRHWWFSPTEVRRATMLEF